MLFLLEVTHPLENLVVLNYSSESMGSIESGSGPRNLQFDRSAEGPVRKNGWVNLVYPDTRGIGHGSSFYEPSMVDPKLVECTRVIR